MPKKICVIGGGRWGKNHIRTLSELKSLSAISDIDPDSLEKYKQRYPDLTICQNIDEAVTLDVDGYIVATPAVTHFEIAKILLNAGRPVLVEKPLAMTSQECIELKNLSLKNKVCLMVGHIMLFHPAIKKIKETIQSGRLGKLQYIYSNRVNLGTVRKEENILWSFAPHDISIFQELIGMPPVEIISRGGSFLREGIHDTTMTTLSYPGNIRAHIFLSWLHPFKEHRIVVIGSDGMLSFEDSSPEKQIYFYEKGINWINGEPIPHDEATEILPYDKRQPLEEELIYFMDHLDVAQPKVANADSAIEVLKILEKASVSLMENKRDSSIG